MICCDVLLLFFFVFIDGSMAELVSSLEMAKKECDSYLTTCINKYYGYDDANGNSKASNNDTVHDETSINEKGKDCGNQPKKMRL